MKIAILIFLGFLVACSVPYEKIQQNTLDQVMSVGQIRANITEHFYDRFSVSVCFTSNPTQATVVSYTTAKDTIMNTYGYVYGEDDEIDYYLDQLDDSSVKAVKVVVTVGEITYQTIFVPNKVNPTKGLFFDHIRPVPSSGQTCVSCIAETGQRHPCTCVRKTITVCGDNPTVSCTTECTYCPSGSNFFDRSKSICELTIDAPYDDTTAFTSLSVNDSLLP